MLRENLNLENEHVFPKKKTRILDMLTAMRNSKVFFG